MYIIANLVLYNELFLSAIDCASAIHEICALTLVIYLQCSAWTLVITNMIEINNLASILTLLLINVLTTNHPEFCTRLLQVEGTIVLTLS